MELAALATAAVPGLSPTGVAVTADDARDFSSATVTDAEGNTWRIRSPQHHEASVRLETELQILRGFSTAIRAELPFRLPSVAGAVRRGEMRTFVYNHLPGTPLTLEGIAAAPAGAEAGVGRAIAAIHDVDHSVVDNADLPRYTADRFRQRRLNELDQAATTGRIPAVLLRRWETALEDRALWEFTPAVVHGDLHEDNLLMEGERVVALTGWTDLHIGDPATDFAWLTSVPQTGFVEGVLNEYRDRRQGLSDPHIMRRAALAAEFALAQWMVRGLELENADMIAEAETLLTQLAADVEATGGQPIALTSAEQAAPAGPDHGEPDAPWATDEDPRLQWAQAARDDDEPAVITDASLGQPEVPEPSAREPHTPVPDAPAPYVPEDHIPEDPELRAFPRAAAEDAPTDQFAPIAADPMDLPAEDPFAEPAAESLAAPAVESSGDEHVDESGPAPAPAEEFIEPPAEAWLPNEGGSDVEAELNARHAAQVSLPADEDTATGEFPVVEPGDLPIDADPEAERRAATKNYFPAAAADAAPGVDEDDYTEPIEAAPAPAEQRSRPGPAGSEPHSEPTEPTEFAESAEPTEHARPKDSAHSIYTRHPGLRPPG